ncbi:MAG: hypothetical protein HOO96_26465 [Polyangiaceae bacterium]|nr:hypothetical protein [Polyangiaceae bacterium]
MRPFAKALLLGAGSGLVACSLLVRFDDDAPLADGGPAASEAGSGIDAAKADAGINRDAGNGVFKTDANPCTAGGTGLYCAIQGKIGSYPGKDPLNHLVECSANKVKQITVCGQGCFVMPPGVPDVCDDCITRPKDGRYCGFQFDWPTLSDNLVITCKNNHITAFADECGAKNQKCVLKDAGAVCSP